MLVQDSHSHPVMDFASAVALVMTVADMLVLVLVLLIVILKVLVNVKAHNLNSHLKVKEDVGSTRV